MSKPVWLEVALNGAWSRARQPLMPVAVADIVAEGVACAEAGAAVIHLHAYDQQTGNPCEDADIYTRVIEGIRAKCDAIVYPTIGFSANDPEAPGRYGPLEVLAERGLLEWIPIDPGSLNINRYDGIAAGLPGRYYLNSDGHIKRGLALATSCGAVPTYAVYEAGFIRLGAALTATVPGVKTPVYRFMFTGDRAWGFPPEAYALDAYRRLLRAEAGDVPWMIAGHGVDLRKLIPITVGGGGHVRVGLEDAPWGTELGNIDWVKSAVALIEASGGRMANATEIRASLG
ncbi:MAG: 3-keto-5-aminohexanoate cleavage protein [Rhodospirillales bacterium]|nr:3-keto-5-aminohexanoate cleavage protein [Rhodospirillales bacterium]